MKKSYIILIVIILLAGFATNVESNDGSDLLTYCNKAIDAFEGKPMDDFSSGQCLGMLYAIGYTNYVSSIKYKNKPLFCTPPVQMMKSARIVVKYLKDHPEKLHEEAVGLAVEALSEAFPCNK